MPGTYIDMKNCQFFIQGKAPGDQAGAVNLMAGYAEGDSTLVVDGFDDALLVGTYIRFAGHMADYVVTAKTELPSDVTGAVNLMAGYNIGDTTIVVDNFVGIIPSGVTIKFAGHATEYTVSGHTETSTDTTGLTFAPALTASVADDEVITVLAGIKTIGITIDPPLMSAVVDDEVIDLLGYRLEVTIGEGNLTFDEKRALEYKKNRGKLDQVRLADEDPIDVNMQFAWTFLSSSSSDTVPTVEEVLKKIGPASAWVSTGANPCEPYAVDLIIKNTLPGCGAEEFPVEQIVLPEFRYVSLAHDPKAGTVTCQGTCNVTQAIRERLAG